MSLEQATNSSTPVMEAEEGTLCGPSVRAAGGPTAHDTNGVAISDYLLRTSHFATSVKVMIVDDEPTIIKLVQKSLRGAGLHDFVSTTDSRDAMRIIRHELPDVVLLDLMMPHVNGLHILEAIRSDVQLHHLPVLILTAATDDDVKVAAFEIGATDLLTKPLKPMELVPRVRNALIVKAHHDQQLNYSAHLEEEVRLRTTELAQSRQDVIHVLAAASEYRDKETGNHVLRVGRYAGIIARELGFSESRVELIQQAAILHDVGKIGVPDAIMLKPGKLDPDEMDEMKRHCVYGMKILNSTCQRRLLDKSQGKQEAESPILKLAATIAMSHHEKWDGSGYPLGLAGKEIPIEGRIVAVADVFDAVGSRRPYKEPFGLERCLEIIENGCGHQFDPEVVGAFMARIDEILEVAQELIDE